MTVVKFPRRSNEPALAKPAAGYPAAPVTIEEAALRCGVSPSAVRTAAFITDRAEPEILAAVDAGLMTLGRAKALDTKSRRVQLRELAEDCGD
jgi:hypothetical protein